MYIGILCSAGRGQNDSLHAESLQGIVFVTDVSVTL